MMIWASKYTENYEVKNGVCRLFACSQKIRHFKGFNNICNEGVRRFANIFQNLGPSNTVVQLWYTTSFNIQ